ncbi:unnamed protein product, partial [marine sediment metagenome]
MAHGNKSGDTGVIPSGTTRVKPRQAAITIDVVIPAFNEASCIGGVLRDVMMARRHDWFQIQNIYVIS